MKTLKRLLREEDETPTPTADVPKEEQKLSAHHHRMNSAYHRRQFRKYERLHGYSHELTQHHITQMYHHEHLAHHRADEERRAAAQHKKLHGADNARYKTGHVVYKRAGKEYVGGQPYVSAVMHGTVSKHTADHFHVKWEGGEETKHRQSDARTYGSSRTFSMYGDNNSPSHLPYHHKTPEEHKLHVASELAKAKGAQEHIDRIRKAQSGLASHHHSHVSQEHLERMESLHRDIEAGKKKNESVDEAFNAKSHADRVESTARSSERRARGYDRAVTRAEGDERQSAKEMSQMHREDAKDLRKVTSHIRGGKLGHALRKIDSLDTIVRDSVHRTYKALARERGERR